MKIFDSLELYILFRIYKQKTRLLIVGGGRVNGESIFPGPSNGETLGEL